MHTNAITATVIPAPNVMVFSVCSSKISVDVVDVVGVIGVSEIVVLMDDIERTSKSVRYVDVASPLMLALTEMPLARGIVTDV
jgi:hypothetical protein